MEEDIKIIPQKCRIPRNYIPHKYDIEMTINIKQLTYSLILKLDLEVINPSNYVILNAIEDKYYAITSLSLQRYDRISDIFNEISNTFTTKTPVFEDTIEECIHIPIPLETPLFKEDKLTLIIKLEGNIQKRDRGFYISYMSVDLRDELSKDKNFTKEYDQSFLKTNDYSTNTYLKELVFAIVSEPIDSRTIFPCFDEPCYKSVFAFRLRLEKPYVDAFPKLKCLTNGELIKVEEVNNSSHYEFTYSDTPLMSIYLFTLVIGSYDFLETINDQGTKIRVFTPINEQHDGALAMEITQKSIKFYESFFDIPYMYPKMDLVSIPSMAFRALENWGCIVFINYAMLFNHFQCLFEKILIARTISHEISHMWFGNLVTMEWWNELWLNEGFARILEFLCCKSIMPNYPFWDHFCDQNRENTFINDEANDIHPVKAEIIAPKQIQSSFDQITYSKGSNMIKMLYEYIGEDTFKKSVRLYLKKFAYKNTVSSDLWECFNEITQQDIKTLMNSWIELPGHPILDIDLSEKDKEWVLTITQSPIIKDHTNEWIIPLFIKTSQKEYNILLKEKSIQLPIEATLNVSYEDLITKKNFIIINSNLKGYYRVNYLSDILYNNILTIRHKDITSLDIFSLLSYEYSFKHDYCKFLDILNKIKPITNHLLLSYSWKKYRELKKMFTNEGYESLYDKSIPLEINLDSFFFNLIDISINKQALKNKLFIHDDNAIVYNDQSNDEYENYLLKFLCLIGEDKEIISFIINQFDTQFIFTHKNLKFTIYEIIFKYTFSYTNDKAKEKKYCMDIIHDISNTYYSNSYHIRADLLMSASNISYLSEELCLFLYNYISINYSKSNIQVFYNYFFAHARNMKRLIGINIILLAKNYYNSELYSKQVNFIDYLHDKLSEINVEVYKYANIINWITNKIEYDELSQKVYEHIKDKISKINDKTNKSMTSENTIDSIMIYFVDNRIEKINEVKKESEENEKQQKALSNFFKSLLVNNDINSIEKHKI